MSELDETKFWVALTKLETVMAEKFQELTAAQLHTNTKLQELITVVHDLGVIVASHERRLAELEP